MQIFVNMKFVLHNNRYLSKAVTNYLPLALPTQVAEVFTLGRAFASAVLPVSGIKHACAITLIQKVLR